MAHYYSKEQNSDLNLKKIRIKLKNLEYEIYSASGIFSKDKLDNGTELLIENAIIKDNWKILDLGCGYGVVGISLKLKYPSIKVDMADINKRAIMIAKKNVKFLNLDINSDIDVFESNIFSNVKESYDSILINPPQTAGKEICFKMIEESYNHIKERGLLQIVARHKKGGLTLSKKMEEVFGNVKVIANKSGYRVYLSEKI